MNLHENISRLKELMGLITEQEQKKYSTIIILGPQGVGKSTVTKLLGEKLQMPVISSDDYINQGDWAMEKNRKEGWLKRKENEFGNAINFLKIQIPTKLQSG
jgi:predicted AAA+ superfamily ATPase